jgi:hypothetical protein
VNGPLKLAIQCQTSSGEVGSYLFDPGVGIREPFSPVFRSLVGVFKWCRDSGWKEHQDGTAWGCYMKEPT